MCMLCNDEAAYQAYMAYLDDLQLRGESADPDKAVDAVLDAMSGAKREAPDTTLSVHTPSVSASVAPARFSCDPVDK